MDPQAARALFSLADADELITASGIRTPALRVAKDGRILAEAAYTQRATLAGKPVTGLVDPRRLLALFDDGATIVFQGLQRYWPPITELVADLERELGHPCQANAYLTPPGAQGFATHADTHDVLVLQTEGTKEWELPDEQITELHMSPGRCVYLPTGTRHAARTQESVSLHLTIGINQLTVHGVLRRAFDAALREVADEHLPAGLLDDPAAAREIVEQRLADLRVALAGTEVDALVRRHVESVATTRPPRLAGALLDRVSLATDSEALTDQTRLERRPSALCELRGTAGGERLLVLLADRTIEMPGELVLAMERIAKSDSLTPGDLADVLDPTSRIVLCRRLIRDGLLRISPAGT